MKVDFVKVYKENKEVFALRLMSDGSAKLSALTGYRIRKRMGENNYHYLSPSGWVNYNYELKINHDQQMIGKDSQQNNTLYLHIPEELQVQIEPGPHELQIKTELLSFRKSRKTKLTKADILWSEEPPPPPPPLPKWVVLLLIILFIGIAIAWFFLHNKKLEVCDDIPHLTTPEKTTTIGQTVLLSLSDFAKDNHQLEIVSCQTSAKGVQAEWNTQTIRYRASEQLQGIDTLTCVLKNPCGKTKTATASIIIIEKTPQPPILPLDKPEKSKQPPVAHDDYYQLQHDKNEDWFDILGNDTDPDGDKLSVTYCQGIAKVRVQNNGVVYERQNGIFGTLTGLCQIRNTAGLSDTATLTIEVQPRDFTILDTQSINLATDKMFVELDILRDANITSGDNLQIKSCQPATNVEIRGNHIIYHRPQDLNWERDRTFSCQVVNADGISKVQQITAHIEKLQLHLLVNRQRTSLNLREWLQQQTGWSLDKATCMRQSLPTGIQFSNNLLTYDMAVLDKLSSREKNIACKIFHGNHSTPLTIQLVN